ncbi:CCA tRNA nucleotidyltransferase [Chloroflexota bacterium]
MENLKLYVRPDALRLLNDISRFLIKEGVQAYLVGGFVRDMLLERDTADIDIAVAVDALTIAPKIASALGGKYISLDEENGVGRVVLFHNESAPAKDKWELDFTTLKGTIEQDLAQRDFTVDAMAIELDNITGSSLNPDSLIDPFHGRDDLRQRVIRAVRETAFREDAARLIRAVRLAAELVFDIDAETEELIHYYSNLITNVAGERVRDELLRLLATPGAARHLAYLDELGILTALIPELVPAKGVDQPKVHVWDVFDHSIQTVSTVEFLLRERAWEYAGEDILGSVPWSIDLSRHFDEEISCGSTRKSLLKLAALLHDIAKPQTKALDEDGRARFLGHPQEGAATATKILERLRFSTKEINLVELMVKHHLRPTQMSHEEFPSRRAIYRYYRDTGEAGIDILFLCLADHLATRGSTLDPAQWLEHTRIAEYILTKYTEEESLLVPPKLINGNDLMESFNLSPGPMLGELLEALRETQAAGEVATRQEALDYIKHLLTQQAHTSRKEYIQGEI